MHRRADLGIIRAKVNEIVAASPVARQVTGTELIPDTDGDGDEYIRVEISLRSHTRTEIDQLTDLTKKIWDAVDELDERFASVQFPDAA